MESAEIRALQTPEITAKLEEAQLEQFKLRFQFRSGQLTNYTRLSAGRRTIARMMTVLRERELAAEMAAKGEQA